MGLFSRASGGLHAPAADAGVSPSSGSPVIGHHLVSEGQREAPNVLPEQCDSILDRVEFGAKIDYVSVHAQGRCKLPPLSGKAIWPSRHRGQRLTVHDATVDDILAIRAALGNARIAELEVAVDVRPRKWVPASERDDLLQAVMIDVFARGLEPSNGVGMVPGFRALYRRKGTGYTVRPFNKGLPKATDQQLHGGRGDPAQVKNYLKRRDQGATLSIKRHAARLEVRLGSAGLPDLGLLRLEDLLGFRFRKMLMPYFRHVRGTRRVVRGPGAATPMMAVLTAKLEAIDHEHWNQAGIGAFLAGGKRAHGTFRFKRNTPVNNRIGQALTRLEERFAKAKFVRADHAGHVGNPSLARLSTGSAQSPMTT